VFGESFPIIVSGILVSLLCPASREIGENGVFRHGRLIEAGDDGDLESLATSWSTVQRLLEVGV
jgi:hypothetical protein